jgi:hypothetical protein
MTASFSLTKANKKRYNKTAQDRFLLSDAAQAVEAWVFENKHSAIGIWQLAKPPANPQNLTTD